MPAPLTGYITAWQAKYTQISADCWQLGNALLGAATYIAAQNWNFAAMYLEAAGESAHEVAHHFKFEGDDVYAIMYDAMHWIDDNIGDGVELNMAAILDAIWNSDRAQTFEFISYIDAMRASIWNTEVYDSHMRDLYMWFSLD